MQKHIPIVASLLVSMILASGAPAMAQSAPPAQNQGPGGQRPAAGPETKMDRKVLRQACAADTQKLCVAAEAGGGKIMQCLRSHRAELSSGCQSAWEQLQTDRKAMRSQLR